MWNLDGGVDPAFALAGSEDADEEHRANPAARVAAARGDDRPGLRDRVRVLLAPLGSGGRPGHSVRRAATRRRQRPPATLMTPTDATRVVRLQRRPGTASAEVWAIGGRGGEEAKIDREERSASGGGVDWPQTEEHVSEKAGENLLFSI